MDVTATILRYTEIYVIHSSGEYILQHANRLHDDQSEFIQAPQPLLPNYGVGRLGRYNLDNNIMTLLNSEGRRLEDFIRLCDEVGLKLEKIWNIGDIYADCGVASSLVKGASISSSLCSVTKTKI